MKTLWEFWLMLPHKCTHTYSQATTWEGRRLQPRLWETTRCDLFIIHQQRQASRVCTLCTGLPLYERCVGISWEGTFVDRRLCSLFTAPHLDEQTNCIYAVSSHSFINVHSPSPHNNSCLSRWSSCQMRRFDLLWFDRETCQTMLDPNQDQTPVLHTPNGILSTWRTKGKSKLHLSHFV